jgi:uncharacterized membrane protein
MTSVYLDTPDGSRTEEHLGPWSSLDRESDAIVRIEPFDDEDRRSFRRAGPDRLELLDRQERPLDTSQKVTLERDPTAEAARLTTPRTLFRGWLARDSDALLLTACGGGKAVVVRDVSPESVITAALTDVGLDSYGTLYLEAWGIWRDGELLIGRLNRAGHDLDCPESAVRFKAQGHGAGWSLESGPSRTTFAGPEGDSLNAPALPLSWRWPGGRQDRAEAMLSSSTEAGAMKVRLHPTICRDTAAAAVYGFTSTVTVTRNGPAIDYAGCAYLGNEPLY